MVENRAVTDKQDDAPLVFYYNREERIARAPKIVRDYYSGKNKPVTGLFKVLVATPAKRFLFLTIIALCVIVIFLQHSLSSDSEGNLDGVPVSLSAFMFEDTVYVSLKLAENAKFKDRLAITAGITMYTAENQVFETREFSRIYAGSEVFIRTTIPDYDILRVEAAVSSGRAGQSVKLKTPVTRG
jgi:hypothetical protein